MDTIRGKFMIRPTTTLNGNKVMVLCGVVSDTNFPIPEDDEMWAVELLINDVIKFDNCQRMNFSPEDFLANDCYIQNPKMWSRKTVDKIPQ